MKHHAEQTRLVTSSARFRVVPAGRRSGKTERAKRFLVKEALSAKRLPAAYAAAAPTRDQAKRIFWSDLKLLTPAWAVRNISESSLTITLHSGVEIVVVGMDKPERIEGTPWAGLILDEYANMKPEAWPLHVRPALSDLRCADAWCWFTGVPEGRNHYYDLYQLAMGPYNIAAPPQVVDGVEVRGNWDAFTWWSEDILEPSEIAQAKMDLDELSYRQEYRGEFVNFAGQAYHCWDENVNSGFIFDRYNPRADIGFCFDFNVDPGVAVIVQEMALPIKRPTTSIELESGIKLFAKGDMERGEVVGTGVIGEVHIPNNSNTPAVCKKLIADWGDHKGAVYVYGDATGGARKTSATEGSDWDLVRTALCNHYGRERVFFSVPDSNPTERARVNAMNTRLRTMAGDSRLMVDRARCPMTKKDFEGVKLLAGGSGEIDKRSDPKLTHLTDALGYYVERKFPVRRKNIGVEDLKL